MPSHNCQEMAPSVLKSLLVDQVEERRAKKRFLMAAALLVWVYLLRTSARPPFLAYNALLSVHPQGLLWSASPRRSLGRFGGPGSSVAQLWHLVAERIRLTKEYLTRQ